MPGERRAWTLQARAECFTIIRVPRDEALGSVTSKHSCTRAVRDRMLHAVSDKVCELGAKAAQIATHRSVFASMGRVDCHRGHIGLLTKSDANICRPGRMNARWRAIKRNKGAIKLRPESRVLFCSMQPLSEGSLAALVEGPLRVLANSVSLLYEFFISFEGLASRKHIRWVASSGLSAGMDAVSAPSV
jgi:hypothetical protein